MFKFICTIRKKRGMSRQAFIDYYEKQHAPLLVRIMPPIGVYRRNYPQYEDNLKDAIGRGSEDGHATFDVFTEVIFDTRDKADTYMAAFSKPQIQKQIIADEKNFVEPGSVVVYVVDAYESPRAPDAGISP
jgi:uncharacterized protein (TIGR02118 family)